MKTFESEFKELSDWLFERTDIYFENMEKEKPKGHDSQAEYERTQDIREYNRRLDALKKKYGKDVMPQSATATSRSEAERVHV